VRRVSYGYNIRIFQRANRSTWDGLDFHELISCRRIIETGHSLNVLVVLHPAYAGACPSEAAAEKE
jgi:hypothetical protein